MIFADTPEFYENNNFYENLSSKDVQNLINKIKEEKKIHLTKDNA